MLTHPTQQQAPDARVPRMASSGPSTERISHAIWALCDGGVTALEASSFRSAATMLFVAQQPLGSFSSCAALVSSFFS